MANKSPIVLILGSGPNVGQHVARSFAAKGYKTALVSRKAKEEDNVAGASTVNISGDLSDPESIVNVFSKVKELLGIPSVVVHNASSGVPNDPKNPLAAPLENFTQGLNVNTTSAFAAAQQAALCFEQLPPSASKTFIYTGNILNNQTIIPNLMLGGIGKSATAHMIQVAAAAYADRGYKFYYADERKPDGAPAYFDIDGAAHGEHYLQLAEGKSQGPWQQTFVKGIGYKKF